MADFANASLNDLFDPDVLVAADRFISRSPHPMVIGGEPVMADDTVAIEDPATGDPIGRGASGTPANVDRAVAAAAAALADPAWRYAAPEARGALLHAIADRLEAHAEELAAIQSRDLGASRANSRALVAGGIEAFRYYAGWPTRIYGDTVPADGRSLTWTKREPLGVIGAIIPWNGPAQASAWKIGPALACGNTVVFKPASEAAFVAIRMVELILDVVREAGLPPGIVNLVSGPGAVVGEAMVRHPGIAKVTFTGSTAVGRTLMALGAETLKKVTLELGGKAPTIIFADADLDKAVPAAVAGFCAGAGQGCVAGSRILIEASIYEDVVRRIAEAASAQVAGSAFEEGATLPPIVSRKQLDRILAYIESGRSDGARLVTGGERVDRPGYFVQPTLFADATPDMTIVREEIFGPVAAAMPFEDEADAIRLANDSQFGLSASVWTSDASRIHRMVEALQAGTVWANTIFELDTKAPFGGYKQSGLGRELGADSIEAFTQIKTAMLRFSDPPASA